MPYKYNETFEKALKDWVEDELSGESVTCIAEMQDFQAPKPGLPFVTYRVDAPVLLQSVDDITYRSSGDNVGATHKNTRQFSVYLSYYGDSALAKMVTLQRSISKDTVRAAFRTAGFSVIRIEPLQDTTIFLETGFEKRASFDLICATRESWSETLYRIDSIDYEGTLDSLKDTHTVED